MASGTTTHTVQLRRSEIVSVIDLYYRGKINHSVLARCGRALQSGQDRPDAEVTLSLSDTQWRTLLEATNGRRIAGLGDLVALLKKHEGKIPAPPKGPTRRYVAARSGEEAPQRKSSEHSPASGWKEGTGFRRLIDQVITSMEVDETEARRLLRAITASGAYKIASVNRARLHNDIAAVTNLELSEARRLVTAIEAGDRYRLVRTGTVIRRAVTENAYELPTSIRSQLGLVPGTATYAQSVDPGKKRGTASKNSQVAGKKPVRAGSVRAVSAGLPTLGRGHR